MKCQRLFSRKNTLPAAEFTHREVKIRANKHPIRSVAFWVGGGVILMHGTILMSMHYIVFLCKKKESSI